MLKLFDQSGGKGLMATDMPARVPNKARGYAGGLSAGNVSEFIERIPGTGPYWLDMESGVRVDGWFSVYQCWLVCEAIWKR